MIDLFVNGDAKTLASATTSVAQALETWGYKCNSIAVALNGDFVPRSQYSDTLLSNNDKLDIVAPIQGG